MPVSNQIQLRDRYLPTTFYYTKNLVPTIKAPLFHLGPLRNQIF